MVAVLKHDGTLAWFKTVLKMSVGTKASWFTPPEQMPRYCILSIPAAPHVDVYQGTVDISGCSGWGADSPTVEEFKASNLPK